MKPKLLFLIDASLLKESDCLRKVHYIHNEGLTTIESNFKMDYGTAFHKFVAAYNRGLPLVDCKREGAAYYMEKCIRVPEGDFRTIDHFIEMIDAYDKGPFNRHIDLLKPKMINGKAAVELQFCFPYETTPDYDVLLKGTVDLSGLYDNSREVINDYKVTAIWNQQNYLDQYDLDPQLQFYSYVFKRYGLSQTYLPGLITGIFIKKPTKSKVNKVTGKREEVLDWNGVSFGRSSLIEFTDEGMVEFERWMDNKIHSIIEDTLSNKKTPNFNCCTDVFGPCMYKPLCLPYNKDNLDTLKKMYHYRRYDPAEFQK